MTQVRIRHQDDTESQYLADVPFDRLDDVIPTVHSWGLNGEQPALSGQFSYSDDADCYFEVVIHEESE